MGGVVFRALLLVGFCWFLLFAVLKTIVVPSTSSSFNGFMSRGETREEGLVLNYVSKRRVPNGPDPIHNRRTRNNRQPPDRA